MFIVLLITTERKNERKGGKKGERKEGRKEKEKKKEVGNNLIFNNQGMITYILMHSYYGLFCSQTNNFIYL